MSALLLLLAVPAAGGLAVVLAASARSVLAVCVLGSVAAASVTIVAAAHAFRAPVLAAGDQLFLDAFGAYHALIVVGVFVLSSIYACYYFAPEIAAGSFDARKARRFGLLWFLFLASMLLTLASNNVGLMWVGMEATTIASALLVCLDRERRTAIRAAWTYLVMCSVAIALALLGVIVLSAEARAGAPDGASVFLWTDLRDLVPRMRPGPVRLAFLFALVGYGTKAGLAPMHSWLPEAHGQAPTPVSAVLSGVLLNCAVYCLCRFLPIVDPLGTGWALRVLIPFGVISVAVAAAFIVHERDVKRLLAFSTVEHIGIITLGLGFAAPAAALFHTLNHSVCKMLAFFCAGALAQRHRTREMARMNATIATQPIAGAGFLLGVMALVGMPPFSVFMSELWIARAGIEHGHPWAVIGFVAGAAIVFIAALRRAVEMTWGHASASPPSGHGSGHVGWPLVVGPLALMLIVGLWMPSSLREVLTRAAAPIGIAP